jgi:hypothetical protein
MVGGALARASAFRVGLGVSGAIIAPGLRACPSRSCGGWVCCLGVVGASLVFGLVRGSGAFVTVLPSVVLVSRIHLAQRYRGNIATSFSAASSSRREAMVGGVLTRAYLLTSALSLGISGLLCRTTQCM